VTTALWMYTFRLGYCVSTNSSNSLASRKHTIADVLRIGLNRDFLPHLETHLKVFRIRVRWCRSWFAVEGFIATWFKD